MPKVNRGLAETVSETADENGQVTRRYTQTYRVEFTDVDVAVIGRAVSVDALNAVDDDTGLRVPRVARS
ncbi:MAG: hypothetical protein AAFP90_24250, partial [Planctomycetota bacterium]